MDLKELTDDGTARIGLSLYPAHVTVGSNGVSASKFLLIAHPDGGWVAGSWYSNPNGGEPITQVIGKVSEIHQYTARRIHMTLESGDDLVLKPSKGCRCGSTLPSYNPFGNQIQLSSVPGPKATE